jgi:hypothetical protein
VAPPEVSALPDCGMVADLDASGGTVFAVGGFEGGNEFSVAITGVNPMASAVTVIARRRVMTSFFPVANYEQRCGLELRRFGGGMARYFGVRRGPWPIAIIPVSRVIESPSRGCVDAPLQWENNYARS